MARVSTYLNFMGNTEDAFAFYKEVFGGEYIGDTFRMGDMPGDPSAPPLPAEVASKIMHIELEILGGHVIMATDMIESMGHSLTIGNNTTLNLEPDTEDEAHRLYNALVGDNSENSGGLQHMPWGLWGTCLDNFGIRWMFNCRS